MSLSIQGFAGKDSEEFQKHFKAVQFCIENDLSFPKETSEFFKGKVGGDDLEDIESDSIIKYIENGVQVDFPTTDTDFHGFGAKIKVADIPSEVDEIIIEFHP